MLPSLAQWMQGMGPEFGFLRVFQYLTFRAVMAAMTALLVGVMAGPWFIRRLTALKIGQPVRGYRAPSFSIGAANLWALDTLQEAGYRYSSSIYPIAHDHYGMPDAPRFAFQPRQHALLEVPPTTVNMLGRNFPASGGGYFRLLPYGVSAWMMRRVSN